MVSDRPLSAYLASDSGWAHGPDGHDAINTI